MNKKKRCQEITLAILFIFFICSLYVLSQPNPPSNLLVVPRYGATIELLISWNDNSTDEDGFRIERREEGTTAWSWWTTVGPFAGTGLRTHVDNTATPDKMWEYRVCATNTTSGNSAFTDVSYATSPHREWPIDDGDNDILHSFGTPLDFGAGANHRQYFHEGVDISASGKQVNASHGGTIASINGPANNGGGMRVNVDYGPPIGVERETYQHTIVDAAWGAGDRIAPGDRIGTVNTTWFGMDPEANHVHWGTRDRYHLKRFSNSADCDPNGTAPIVADINNDGEDFIVVSATNNDHNNPVDPAWGDVDFLVDAYDDMSANTGLMTNPYKISYWIQSGISGGEDVRSSADPYCLIEFDFFIPGPQALQFPQDEVVYWDLPADLQGINTWGTRLTWIITNTRGTNGTQPFVNVDALQFWRSDARKGTGVEPNGSDAQRARENQEARFPDGTYFAHIILEDLDHSGDYVRPIEVDNSRPYVQKVTVYSGNRIVYLAEWVWDTGTAQLSIQPTTFDEAAAFTALRTQDITVEIEFSEPMQSASITSIAPLGVAPTLSSDQSQNARNIWKGVISNLDIADDGSDDGTHMMTISGVDLAGNQLLQINNRNSMGANHHNRDAAGNMQGTTGSDTIHGFKVGPLEGVIPITALFVKQTAADPVSPIIADKALQLQQALNNYFDEVSYGEISFAVTGHGWYQLNQTIDWYYTSPRTPLIDLVQEAISSAESDGVDVVSSDYILVVTDETDIRVEWSTNGAWPYMITTAPGWKLIASGTLNLASSDPRVSNLAGRMVGLIDLFAYPEVTVSRPFVGPWSHMSDKDQNVHVLGWEKWRANWLDETGTATGKTLTRVPKPAIASPIVDQAYTILPLDSSDDGTKMVAIEIGDRLHYTAEYRRQQNLDTDLPDDGILIVKTNDYINQGEGPAIVNESSVTSGDLSDATYKLISPRDVFDDVGSGVQIEVTAMNANQAEIRLNYQIPPQENDVYVRPQDSRYRAENIWIDAPDLEGGFEVDPLSVKDANEKPVVGELNKVYGRVLNQGHADATNFEVHLEIREPWGAGGPWRSLKVDTVSLLQGQDNSSDAYYIIEADWTPTGDVHSCVKLSVHGVANDINIENNQTQKNISQFVSTPGSPYTPVTSLFEVENPYDETITVFFKLDGLPPSWSYILAPERLIISPKGVGEAQVTIQPHEVAPLCSKELITISAYTPRVDTLKRLGAITLNVALKNEIDLTMEAWVHCGKPNYEKRKGVIFDEPYQEKCIIYAQGCTNPILPNSRVAVVYTNPDGEKEVHYVTTDENGCYLDMITAEEPGLWEAQAVIEEADCQAEARSPKQPLYVEEFGGLGGKYRYFVHFGPNFPVGKFNTTYDPGFSLTGGFERLLWQNFSIMGILGSHQFYSPSQNQNFVQISVNLKYTYFSWGDKFAYIQAGSGVYFPNYGNSSVGVNVGTGLTWIVTPRLGLDLNIDYHFIGFSDEEFDKTKFFDIQMGLIWRF